MSADLRTVSNGSATPAQPATPIGSHPQVIPMPLREGALRASLERIQRQSPTREAFLVEAVRVIATQAGATAGAALYHDPSAGLLRLVHAFGLRAEALPALCTPSLWDVPRRAMHNQQICVIDSAHQSPFVPKELVAASPDGLSIAVIPFFGDGESRGSIVLFSPRCNWFSDDLVATLGRTLRLFASAFLDPAESGAASSPASPNESALLRTLEELRSEKTRLSQALAEAERQRMAEAIERVTAQSFLEAERQRLLVLEREIESLRTAVAAMKHEPDDAQRSHSRERAAHEAKRDRFGRLDEIISSLSDEERVRKGLEAPSPGARGAEPAPDEPLGVVHIAAGDLPHETPLPASRPVPRAPAVVVVDSTEHAGSLLQRLEAGGCTPYILDDGAAPASLAPTVAGAANLTTPAAWWRVAALRSAWGHSRSGLVGYVLPARSDQGTWLGTLDVCLRSVESAELVERLRSFVANPSRVILVSGDAEVMRMVLEQMNAADVSTVLVSQAAKVADLLPIARPEAAILHVSPASPGVFAAIAAIRSHDTHRDLPLLCLLDPAAGDEQAPFFESGIRQLLSADPLPARRVIEAVVAGIGQHRLV